MRKNLSLLLAAALVIGALAGCGQTKQPAHSHSWTAATCTEPKTCSECGETEGAPLGHDWKAATCTEPKTCARCGETEGEALGHDWADATCTEPKTCARCGATEGEPLGHTPLEADHWTPSLCAVCGAELGPVIPPDYEAVYGLEINTELGKTCDMPVTCYQDTTKTTAAHFTVTSYEVQSALEGYTCGDGTVWNLEGKDGFEWRTVSCTIRYDDDNFKTYGTYGSGYYFGVSYYDDLGLIEEENQTQTDYGLVSTAELPYKGETYEVTVVMTGDWAQDQEGMTYYEDFAFLVPIGFDGCLVGNFDYYPFDQRHQEDHSFFADVDDSLRMFRLS